MIFPFNFRHGFRTMIVEGRKRQTYRRNRADGKRPQPGDTFRGYVGLRTRDVELIIEAPVLRCRGARLDTDERELILDGAPLTCTERNAFARLDGFRDFDEMILWFRVHHTLRVIEGFVVEWDFDHRVRR